jgi:hypothetical protein
MHSHSIVRPGFAAHLAVSQRQTYNIIQRIRDLLPEEFSSFGWPGGPV